MPKETQTNHRLDELLISGDIMSYSLHKKENNHEIYEELVITLITGKVIKIRSCGVSNKDKYPSSVLDIQ